MLKFLLFNRNRMTCVFREEALYKCSKPYQYVGGEFLSYNKDFDSAKFRFAFLFPDKYEIGISNLGVRILYDLVNKNPDWMADRAYAPEPDFKPEILYGVESKRPLKDFDAIGFSLQYEMSYPTVLKLLEMSGIPYRNDLRGDDDPIIVAGGPCTFNPLPLADFIDVFLIGDGEDNIVETCEILEKTKGMPREERIKALTGCSGKLKVESGKLNNFQFSTFNFPQNSNNINTSGRWSALTGGRVQKRIAQLTYETALKKYPIPYSTSVQDRAVVEIRRGCGRMCRFCQPGHVTLPIREREAEDIIKITKELVKNTGYDEYSLLSLSSNDYKNINEVIKELAVDFNEKKVSVSLPSQRIDGFNLELANLVQSVRKSTMTLAPEAGSQRLRNVIKKNITEDMIINAVTTLYENGWSRVKFYFICGLPTETLEDMDEMAELLRKIKWKCKQIKKEKGLTHGMDITCTLSIFVPKPFTPFQWCGQMPLDKVSEHIRYLKEKISHVKGVKINYHEQATSQIEAVLTRGDKSLCKYIEMLYKKGCYLDAWGEYFDENIWHETAVEAGINLSELAQKEYLLDEELPWDFVDVGLDKSWLVNEYEAALCSGKLKVESGKLNNGITEHSANSKFDNEKSNNFQLSTFNFQLDNIVPTCETKCVNCGVCKNLGVKKMLAKKYAAKNLESKKIESSEGKLVNKNNLSEISLGQQSDNSLSSPTLLSSNSPHPNPPRPGREQTSNTDLFAENAEISQKQQSDTVISPYRPIALSPDKSHSTIQPFNRSTYRLKLTKTGNLRFLSHLDWQNTFVKALSRSGLDVAFSQGFNPIMKVSMGVALPLFCESDGELVDIELNENISTDEVKQKLEKVLPKEAKIISIVNLEKSSKAIDVTAQWAEYKIEIFDKTLYDFESLRYNTNEVLSSSEIFIEKKNKKGLLKKTDIKPSIKSYEFKDESLFIVLKTGQTALDGGIPALRADVLMNIIAPDVIFKIKRTRFFDSCMNEL